MNKFNKEQLIQVEVNPGRPYISTPERVPEAQVRGLEIADVIRQELQGRSDETLEEAMRVLRGRSWS